MRWRFTDRVLSFSPWEAISGVKAVSLEEYHLLKPLGRDGAFPESLVLEACVELGRWLAGASSGWYLAATLAEVEEMRFDAPAGAGSVLRIDAAAERLDDTLRLTCRVADAGRPLAEGRLLLRLAPLAGLQDPASAAALWAQLCLSARPARPVA